MNSFEESIPTANYNSHIIIYTSEQTKHTIWNSTTIRHSSGHSHTILSSSSTPPPLNQLEKPAELDFWNLNECVYTYYFIYYRPSHNIFIMHHSYVTSSLLGLLHERKNSKPYLIIIVVLFCVLRILPFHILRCCYVWETAGWNVIYDPLLYSLMCKTVCWWEQ